MRAIRIYTVVGVLLLATGNVQADVAVPKAEVQTAVSDYVLSLLTDFEGEVEVSVRRQGDLLVEGTGAVQLRARPSGDRSSARRIPVMLEVHRGPALLREYLLSAEVRYFDRVVVAARSIRRGEPITEEAVRVERREVTTMLGRYSTDLSELEGMRAKMRIGFGRPIGVRYVERIPAVERGDRVRIRADVGRITASTAGLAAGSGAIGDRIVVQNLSSREKLLAEVVAPGVVRVIF